MGSARDLGVPLVHFLRKTVSLVDLTQAPAGVYIGTVPANCFMLQTYARIDQAFNAVTTNVLTVGYDAGVSNMAGAGDITEGTLQTQVIATGAGLAPTTDVDIYAKFTQTGTPATTGRATIAVGYLPASAMN